MEGDRDLQVSQAHADETGWVCVLSKSDMGVLYGCEALLCLSYQGVSQSVIWMSQQAVCMYVCKRSMSRLLRPKYPTSKTSWTCSTCLFAAVPAVKPVCHLAIPSVQIQCQKTPTSPTSRCSSVQCARRLQRWRHLGMLSQVVWLLPIVLEVVSSIIFECVCPL